jgi:hypothetical protein
MLTYLINKSSKSTSKQLFLKKGIIMKKIILSLALLCCSIQVLASTIDSVDKLLAALEKVKLDQINISPAPEDSAPQEDAMQDVPESEMIDSSIPTPPARAIPTAAELASGNFNVDSESQMIDSSIPTPPAGPVPTAEQLAQGDFVTNLENQINEENESKDLPISEDLPIIDSNEQSIPVQEKTFTIYSDNTIITSDIDFSIFLKGVNPEIRVEHNNDGTINLISTGATWTLENPNTSSEQNPTVEDTFIPTPPPLPPMPLSGTSSTNSTKTVSTTKPAKASSGNSLLDAIQGFDRDSLKKKSDAESPESSSQDSEKPKKLSFAEQIAEQAAQVTSGSAKPTVKQNEVKQDEPSILNDITNFEFGKNKPATYRPKTTSSKNSNQESGAWKKQQESKLIQNQETVKTYTEKYNITSDEFINYLQELLNSETNMIPYNQAKNTLKNMSRADYNKFQQSVKYNLFTDLSSSNGIIVADLQKAVNAISSKEVAAEVNTTEDQNTLNDSAILERLSKLRQQVSDDQDNDDESDDDEDWYDSDSENQD